MVFPHVCYTFSRRDLEMKKDMALRSLSREQLEELLEIYAKNWLAMDGVWFQSVEAAHGMEEAMKHDAAAWERFTVIEARPAQGLFAASRASGAGGSAPRFRAAVLWPPEPGFGLYGRKCVVLSGRLLPCPECPNPQGHAAASLQKRRYPGVFRLCPHY